MPKQSEIIVLKKTGKPPLRFKGKQLFRIDVSGDAEYLQAYRAKKSAVVLELCFDVDQEQVRIARLFGSSTDAITFLEELDAKKIADDTSALDKADPSISDVQSAIQAVSNLQKFDAVARRFRETIPAMLDNFQCIEPRAA